LDNLDEKDLVSLTKETEIVRNITLSELHLRNCEYKGGFHCNMTKSDKTLNLLKSLRRQKKKPGTIIYGSGIWLIVQKDVDFNTKGPQIVEELNNLSMQNGTKVISHLEFCFPMYLRFCNNKTKT
jgi:hypothetical protein